MIRALAFALAVFAAGPVWAASMKIQDDGRICYNEQCLGAYDTPAEQCEPVNHAQVPDLSGIEYPKANSVLMDFGWTPKPGRAFFRPSPSEQWAVDAGLPIDSCAGSAPVCRFLYTDEEDHELTIIWHRNHSVVPFFACGQA